MLFDRPFIASDEVGYRNQYILFSMEQHQFSEAAALGFFKKNNQHYCQIPFIMVQYIYPRDVHSCNYYITMKIQYIQGSDLCETILILLINHFPSLNPIVTG